MPSRGNRTSPGVRAGRNSGGTTVASDAPRVQLVRELPGDHKGGSPPTLSCRASATRVIIAKVSIGVCYHPIVVWATPLGRAYRTQSPPMINDLPERRP